MSKKNQQRDNTSTGHKSSPHPTSFKTFEECIRWTKKCVYLIARGRQTVTSGKYIDWTTIGSGFVAAPRRFVTAAHVINSPTFQHTDGDKYYLIKNDDEDNWHYKFWQPKMDEDIFVYPDVDLAIINLADDFYGNGADLFMDFNTHLQIDLNFHNIGSAVGVLGYPLCMLTFDNENVTTPNTADILLRCDTGVINCRYKTSEKHHLYEFTISFNPGNSGGPIFDIKTGKVISIVNSYRSIPINIKENELSDDLRRKIGINKYTLDSYLEIIHANYSVGFATPSFKEIFQKHKLV